jgi:excisionase family DNA binding protein
MTTEKEKYITVQTVADRLSCTDDYVYALIRDGKLKAIKIGTRALRIVESSFDYFISANFINPDDYFAPADPEPETKAQRPAPASTARSAWMSK